MLYLVFGLMMLIFLVFLNAGIKFTVYLVYSSGDGQIKVQLTMLNRIHREQSFPIGGMQFVMSKIASARTSSSISPIRMPLMQSIKIITIFLKHIYIQEFRWHTIIGTGDAMYTALSIGSLWALKGMLISDLTFRSTSKTVIVNVQPDFDNKRIYSDLNCIFRIRIVHIMLIAIHIICFKIRRYINGYTTAGKPQPSH